MIVYQEVTESTHSIPYQVPYVPARAPDAQALPRFTSEFVLWDVS